MCHTNLEAWMIETFFFLKSSSRRPLRCDSLAFRHLLWLNSSLKERSVFSEHLFAPFSREVTGQVSATEHIPKADMASFPCSRTFQQDESLLSLCAPPLKAARLFHITCTLKHTLFSSVKMCIRANYSRLDDKDIKQMIEISLRIRQTFAFMPHTSHRCPFALWCQRHENSFCLVRPEQVYFWMGKKIHRHTYIYIKIHAQTWIHPYMLEMEPLIKST